MVALLPRCLIEDGWSRGAILEDPYWRESNVSGVHLRVILAMLLLILTTYALIYTSMHSTQLVAHGKCHF